MVSDRGGQRPDLGRVADQPQPVPQPLDGGPGDEDGPLVGVGGGLVGAQRPPHRGQQPVDRGRAPVAHVHQHEAAGAVGVLGHPGGETGLSEQGRLLVAGDPADRDPGSQSRRPEGCGAEPPARRTDLGQGRHRHPQQLGQLSRPAQVLQIEQHRAGGVRRLGGVHRPAGEVPQHPAVDRAQRQVGVGRHPALVQQPPELGAREVRVEHEPGAASDHVQRTSPGQIRAAVGRTPVLPHDGPVPGPAGAAVPGGHGLPLVGDPDRRHRLGQLGHQLGQHLGQLGPDLVEVVLHPPGAGEVLGQLPVGQADHRRALVDGEGPHPGGSCVDGHHDGHGHHAKSRRRVADGTGEESRDVSPQPKLQVPEGDPLGCTARIH